MIFFLGSEKIELTNWKWKCRMNWTKLRKLWLSLPVINEGWLWSWWKKANQWMQLVTPKGEPMSFEKLTQPVVLTYLILRVRPSQQGISHNSRMKQHHISAWLWERTRFQSVETEKNEVKGPTHAAHLECALTSPGCTIALFSGPKFERIRALDWRIAQSDRNLGWAGGGMSGASVWHVLV